MEATYTFRNLGSSGALKSHAQEKLNKLDKFIHKGLEAHVIFDLEKISHTVEITLLADGVKHVTHETSENMYTSLDRAVEKMERQLRDSKEKLKNHHK